MVVYGESDLDYYGDPSPEDIIRADTTVIRTAVRLIPMYQRGVGIDGKPINRSTAQMLIGNYYELILSVLNRSGESLDPALVQRAHETILDSSLSL